MPYQFINWGVGGVRLPIPPAPPEKAKVEHARGDMTEGREHASGVTVTVEKVKKPRAPRKPPVVAKQPRVTVRKAKDVKLHLPRGKQYSARRLMEMLRAVKA